MRESCGSERLTGLMLLILPILDVLGAGSRANRIIDLAFDVNVEFGVYISPRVVTPGILDHPVWGATPFLAKVKRGSVAL